MKQINQKAISAKVDIDVFAEMELFCKLNNMKRNRLINLLHFNILTLTFINCG